MSGRSSRMVFCQNVPATTVYSPGLAPAPSSPSCVSAPPATTGVPARRPVCPAARRGHRADHGAGVVHRREHAGGQAAERGDLVRPGPVGQAEHPGTRPAGRLGGQHAGQPGRDPVAEHAQAAGPGQDVRPVPGQPAQPGRRGDRHPVAAERVDPIGRALAISSAASWPRAAVDVRAGPDLPAGRVVEHDALAHAGRRRRRGRCRRSRPRPRSASRMQAAIASQLASTSKSWPPGTSGGSRCTHSRRLAATCSPFSVNSTARQLPVPASMASR